MVSALPLSRIGDMGSCPLSSLALSHCGPRRGASPHSTTIHEPLVLAQETLQALQSSVPKTQLGFPPPGCCLHLSPVSLTCISCLHLSHSVDVQPSLPRYPASPSQYQAGVNTAVIYTSSASPASWYVSRCFLFLLCFPHPLPPCSFYKTQFAGTSQGVFLGLPHGIQLPVREAGGKLSIATSQKGVWRPRERFQHLPKVSPALEEPRVQSRVSVPMSCVECKEKEDNYPLPSPPLCHPQPYLSLYRWDSGQRESELYL